ncbi:MAG TPA: DHH family phosphoesterase [Candidatus Paceibacterota bacterium]|nr:DHH family phosphoesterase [Candidatus Pacearchaeota archaeon]HRZ50649.1 DHH family phosphoesterase [Candidatus Paceibacterota bacterium]HSA36454.1 DHH family phosphoesterase [Candidatus Paceibacterota bacterium]
MNEKKEIKNMGEAARRIKEAVERKERIIVYGDADLDGVTSVIICKESIENLGGKVAALYFPDREIEGYGINKTALKNLEKYSPALILAVDLGIGNFEEIKIAKKIGFDVVIVDHHEILDGLPEADVIVDPKQPSDPYPFKLLCAAGLCFRLAEKLLGSKMGKNLRESFAELAALATLADMMPREFENIDIIEEGLETINNSFRPGLRAFFKTDVLDLDSDNFNRRITKIISVLNIRDMKNGIPAAYKLLCAESVPQAEKLIKEFMLINRERRDKIRSVTEEIEMSIEEKNEPIIFEGSRDWELNLLGTIASIICQKHGKPTFIFKTLENESQGTVRSTDEIDSVALMKNCKDLLLTYGGHPKASGFRVKNENLGKFKACLIENLSR